MSDILTNYYTSYYNNNYIFKDNESFYTPNKRLRFKTDLTAKKLSSFGIYLSENNILLISRKKGLKPLSRQLNKNNNNINNNFLPIEKEIKDKAKSHNLSPEERKMLLSSKNNKEKNNYNFNEFDPQLKKCFSFNKKQRDLLYEIKKLKNKKNINETIKGLISKKNKTKKNNQDNENNNDINIKSRNYFYDFSTLKSDLEAYNCPTKSSNNFHTITSIYSNSQNQENRTYYKTVKKDKKTKNIFYKETKRDKINNKKEADKITNELLSLKTKKEIQSYYIKKDYAEAVSKASNANNFNINNCIDPMTYIKFNFNNEPENNNLFKSFNTQIMIMGNQKYRNDLLDGVNIYKNNCVNYEDMRGPTGFDKNKINEKKRNEIIRKMKMNYVGKRGLIFSNRLYKRNFPKKRQFEFDDNYKEVKKLLYKNIEKYEKQIKIRKGKRVAIDVDKKDIKTLKKMDSNAEFIIQDKDEIIKFSNKFLSFDEKVNKLLEKTKYTTDFLFKRAKEHHIIKKKIDQLYDI